MGVCRRRSGARLDGASLRNFASEGESLEEHMASRRKNLGRREKAERHRERAKFGELGSVGQNCGGGMGRWVGLA